MNEIPRLLAWLSTTLKGDSALTPLIGGRIYFGVAPQGAAYPLILVTWRGRADLLGLGAARLWADGELTAVVIGQTGSPLALEAAADRLDALLHGASATVAAVQIYSIVRTAAICRTAPVAGTGVVFTQLGGTYSVQLGAF